MRGGNIKTEVHITLEEAFHGTSKDLKIPNYPIRCPVCSKRWKFGMAQKKCKACGGKGFVEEEKSVVVCVPAGIDNGQSIRIRNKGLFGGDLKDKNRGDLLVQVTVREHPVFTRSLYDLSIIKKINSEIAENGGQVIVDTMDGKINLKIAPGIQDGTKIKIAGKGMPTLINKSAHGDLYVVIQIEK